MTDREKRSDRFQNRFSSGPSTASGDQDKSEKTSNTSKTEGAGENDSPDNAGDEDTDETVDTSESDAENSEDLIEDRKNVLMYLPKDVWRELDIRFDELNARYKRQHGEALEKNRDYYPAVIQAGLTDKDLEEILDL